MKDNASFFSLSTVMDDAFKNDSPVFVIIELTTRCNWRCKHCYLPEHAKKWVVY